MREVISWPIRVWTLVIALDLAIALAVGVALSDPQLLFLLLILGVLTFAFAFKNRLIIEVTTESIRVAGSFLERDYISEIVDLDNNEMKIERSTRLNSLAFLAIRFWVKGGMKIVLDDPRDPTPYWLVSSKKVAEVKKILGK